MGRPVSVGWSMNREGENEDGMSEVGMDRSAFKYRFSLSKLTEIFPNAGCISRDPDCFLSCSPIYSRRYPFLSGINPIPAELWG
jgi:hypothetical protein